MTKINVRLDVQVETNSAATFRGLTDLLEADMTRNLEKQNVLRSFSHAHDPSAEASERWTSVAVFSTMGDGDLPPQNVASYQSRELPSSGS